MAPHVRGRRVLLPRAAEGRTELLDGLVAAGADVVAAPCYRTLAVPASAMAPLADAIARGADRRGDLRLPLGGEERRRRAGARRAALLDRCTLAAIGPTTAAALEEAGLRVAVTPETSTAAALADALARHLGPRA